MNTLVAFFIYTMFIGALVYNMWYQQINTHTYGIYVPYDMISLIATIMAVFVWVMGVYLIMNPIKRRRK